MIPWGHNNEDDLNELEQGLLRQRDVVTNEILNENALRARKDIDKKIRMNKKARAFKRKSQRRYRRGKK